MLAVLLFDVFMHPKTLFPEFITTADTSCCMTAVNRLPILHLNVVYIF